VKAETLAELNAERAARRPALVVTDMAGGQQRLVKAKDIAADKLSAELDKHLRMGTSGMIDPRTAFASPERFPDIPLIADWPDVALPPLKVDHYTAFVALTHDPKIDDPALTHALEKDCFYIGALGSRKTHAKRVERLKQQGVSDAALARIHAPIGLAIGAISPAEVAVAIMAEITQRLRMPKGAAATAVKEPA
jgi:xanthine dehydrogenase accessory factor